MSFLDGSRSLAEKVTLCVRLIIAVSVLR